MAGKIIDAKGLACPKPVVKTKNYLSTITGGEFTVLVDDVISRDNVVRFAKNRGCAVDVEKDPDGIFRIHITKEKNPLEEESVVDKRDTVIFINTDSIGQGDTDLGSALMKSFLFAVSESAELPNTIVFMNTGVKLAVEGSAALDNLQKIAFLKVKIMVCGTCLDYYGLKDRVKVGIVSNMYDIVEEFLSADKVITI